jgi:hypothetical protein
VLFFILIKLFYFYRHSLHGRCAFVSPALFLIMILVIYTDSRTAFFRFAGTFGQSRLKLFSIALGKRPAGATSDAGGDDESPKRSRKLANLFDRIYIAFFRRFFYQRYVRRYFAIPDGNFPSYFIPNRRIRCIYYANINKKYFVVKFYYLALSRCRADVTFINRFLNSRLFQ